MEGKSHLARLLDVEFALGHPAIRPDLDEVGLQAVNVVEIGADLVEIGLLLIGLNGAQNCRLAGARQQDHQDRQKDQVQTAHQESSQDIVEKFRQAICGMAGGKIGSKPE